MILATAVHKTAIIAILFYFLQCNDKDILNNKKKNLLYYSLIMILPIVGVFILKFIFNKFGLLKDYLELQTNFSTTFLLYIVPVLLLIIAKRKEMLETNYKIEGLIRLYALQIPLNIIGWVVQYTSRFALYSGISQVLLLPILQNNIKNEFQKKVITILIILWYVFYFVVMFVILKSNNAFPYKMINL